MRFTLKEKLKVKLLILLTKPFARHGPPTADILGLLIPLVFKILLNFSAKVSNLFSIIVKPFVNKSMSVLSL